MKIEKESLFDAPLLFWLLAPVLGVVLAAPLVVGHIVARLLVARMRRPPRALPGAARGRSAVTASQLNAWASGVNAGAG